MNKINNKYILVELLGKGQFGSICKAYCDKTNKYYAVKLEHKDYAHSLLKHEATILFHLKSQKCKNIPSIYYYGNANIYKCLVMTYCTDSFLNLRKNMTVENKIIWWNTMINVLESIHNVGIVHRDLKPEHFMITNDNKWILIDFGLANTYIKNDKHVEKEQKSTIVGTPNYVSYYVHQGFEPVRRDDFISLLYILWETLYGTFLESYLNDSNNNCCEITNTSHSYNQWLFGQKQWHILHKKINSEITLREEIKTILLHGQHLDFYEKPHYSSLKINKM